MIMITLYFRNLSFRKSPEIKVTDDSDQTSVIILDDNKNESLNELYNRSIKSLSESTGRKYGEKMYSGSMENGLFIVCSEFLPE